MLVLALHYRQPEEVLPEFACALLLLPDAMLKPSERRDAVRVFRAMPLNTGALPRELAELRDMVQQPSGVKHLVWHSRAICVVCTGAGTGGQTSYLCILILRRRHYRFCENQRRLRVSGRMADGGCGN